MENPPSRSHWQAMSNVVSKVNLECQAASVECPNPKICNCVFSEDGSRIFFRGSQRASQASTLLYADLCPTSCSAEAEDMPDEIHAEWRCDGDIPAENSRQPAFPECISDEVVKELEDLPHVYRNEVFQGSLPRAPLTREEQLLHERQRTALSNFSKFHYNSESKSFLFSSSGSVYLASTETSTASASKTSADSWKSSIGGVIPPSPALCTLSKPVLPHRPSARLHLQWCPGSTDVFAFVLDGDLWVASVRAYTETRLTYSNSGEKPLEHNFVTAGLPPYVIQEQFDRFSGFWFQDVDVMEDGRVLPVRYRILYEQVDEHLVEIVSINGDTGPERLRYPRPGGHNALSTLCFVEFSMSADGVAHDIQHYGLSRELHILVPEMEYLINAGWIPGQNAAWVYMMSRLQRHCKLLYIPMESSHPISFQPLPNEFDFKLQIDACHRSNAAPCVPIGLLKEEISSSWINAHNCIHFLASRCSRRCVHFIWAEEPSCGYRSLQYISCPITCIHPELAASSLSRSPSLNSLGRHSGQLSPVASRRHEQQLTGAAAAATTTTDAVFVCKRCSEGGATRPHVFTNGSTSTPTRRKQRYGPDVIVDGRMGTRTRTASVTSQRAPGCCLSRGPSRRGLHRTMSDAPGGRYSPVGGRAGSLLRVAAPLDSRSSFTGAMAGSDVRHFSGGNGRGQLRRSATVDLLCTRSLSRSNSTNDVLRETESDFQDVAYGGDLRQSKSGHDISPYRPTSTDMRTWQSVHALLSAEAQFSSPKRRFYSPEASQRGSLSSTDGSSTASGLSALGAGPATSLVAGTSTPVAGTATPFAGGSVQAGMSSTGVLRLDATVHPITQPDADWQVDPVLCHVDEQHECVYFTGTADSPVECHLYVMCYGDRLDGRFTMLRLTPAGFYHNVAVSPCGRFFVSELSSLSQRPWSVVYDITFAAHYPCLPRVAARCVLGRSTMQLPKRALRDGTPVHAQMFSFLSESGYTLYATVHPPDSFTPRSKYPTVLHVYGGPLFQDVVNQFPSCTLVQMLNSAGFTVVEVDGRGSSRRGDEFEKAVDGCLGVVECVDQAEGLKQAAARFPCVDVARCGVFGWSYGGYMALLLLAKYPELIQSAVSVAPVTDWTLYDTAFTERYLSLPSLNEHGYRQSSVLSLINQFPNIEDRVLVVHGLADENVHYAHTEQLAKSLISRHKPCRILPFAAQRHGIRKPDCNTVLYINMLTLFKNVLR